MKKKSDSYYLLIVFLFSAIILSCNNSENNNPDPGLHENLIYTCPMHPEVVSNKPGICPKCKMNLELKVSDALDQIIAPNKQVLSRQATVKLSTPGDAHYLKSQGYIDLDRNRNQSVSSRFGGRIERLYVKYDMQFVKQGEKILELYSPELNTFQEEHLFLLKTNAEKSLVEQSRQKLKLLGLTHNQISQLENTESFTKTITVYSSSSGYIFFNTESSDNTDSENNRKSSMSNMNDVAVKAPDNSFVSSNDQIREGMYINEGKTLFTINDLQNVWAIVSLSAEHHAAVQVNKKVKIFSELFPNQALIGKIALIEQSFDDNKQRFVKVRIDLANPDKQLKLNSLVTVEINLASRDQFHVPVSAVYRTGFNSFVWVKTGTTKSGTGIFQIRRVITSAPINGIIAVIKGLEVHEEVAEHAAYLVDSETFINEN